MNWIDLTIGSAAFIVGSIATYVYTGSLTERLLEINAISKEVNKRRKVGGNTKGDFQDLPTHRMWFSRREKLWYLYGGLVLLTILGVGLYESTRLLIGGWSPEITSNAVMKPRFVKGIAFLTLFPSIGTLVMAINFYMVARDLKVFLRLSKDNGK